MKRVMNVFLIICLLLSLAGCKSKEEKAEDYLQKNEYNKAYEILYYLDENHTRADECLYDWCDYVLNFNIIDEDISDKRFTDSVTAKKMYDRIKKYCKAISQFSKIRAESVLSILPCVEDFYQDDKYYIQLKEDVNNKRIIEEYIEENEYKQAYDHALSVKQTDEADNCIILWYKYDLYNKDSIDDDLINIKVNKTVELYDLIKGYLQDKVCLTKEESQKILDIFDKQENDTLISMEEYNNIKNSLICKVTGKYMYIVPQWTSLSYEQYYSTMHNYNDASLKKLDDNVKIHYDKIGLGVTSWPYYGEIQYVLYGDYSEYKWDGRREIGGIRIVSHGIYSTIHIDSEGDFDGYWYYYFTQDENKNNNGLYRISINNEKEEILSAQELEGKYILTAFVVDHDVLYTYAEDEDSMTVYRIYLPEMKKDTYTLDIPQLPLFVLLVPQDSEHLKYQTYSAEFIKKYTELKNDKDGLYELLNKYMDVDKDEFYAEFDTMFDGKNYNKYANSVTCALSMEYGEDFVTRYDYSYNIKTKELTMSPASLVCVDYYGNYYNEILLPSA